MRPAHRLDFAVVGNLLRPETGRRFQDGEDLELRLDRDLVARSKVSKAPQKAENVRTELAKRVWHERSKGQVRIMVSREVKGPFVMLYIGRVLGPKLSRRLA